MQATSEGYTSGNDVVVGEVVRYRLSVPLPEGVTPDLTITDTLGAGLTPITDAGVYAIVVAQDAATTHVTADSLTGVNVHAATSVPTVLSGSNALELDDAAVATFSGSVLTVALGDVTNTPQVDRAETLILEFNALVTDAATNVAGATLTNTAVVATGARSLPPVQATVTVREPALSISKVVVGGDSGYSEVETAT